MDHPGNTTSPTQWTNDGDDVACVPRRPDSDDAVVTVHSIQVSNMIPLPLFFLTQDAGATPPLAMWQPTADER